ncbi:hypothetical protein BDD12DRAFT_859596 [Trichophaea hybrida]|nr:hypothetical protein BDD12DRAFT_859596 [Trichophaea hybrida]
MFSTLLINSLLISWSSASPIILIKSLVAGQTVMYLAKATNRNSGSPNRAKVNTPGPFDGISATAAGTSESVGDSSFVNLPTV